MAIYVYNYTFTAAYSESEAEGEGSQAPSREVAPPASESSIESDPSEDSEPEEVPAPVVLVVQSVVPFARTRASSSASVTSPASVGAEQWVPFRHFAELRQTCDFMHGQNQE